MKAVKGVYENGKVELSDIWGLQGPVDILVIFPDETGESSQTVLSEEKKKEILEYFKRRRMEMPPLEGSVKELVEEGRR
ncbi:MAG TPA: hypothetical protein VM163_09805 [bacterium]|nr:hypothetical protein [bacterium]